MNAIQIETFGNPAEFVHAEKCDSTAYRSYSVTRRRNTWASLKETSRSSRAAMALPTLLAPKVGPYRASLLTMANEIITGSEAERMGLVERCVPVGAAYEEALKTARAIGPSAPSVVRLLKRNLGIKKTDLTSELEMSAEQQARDFQTDEYRNRVANYLPDHYA
jgi:enoyl-CoA hydratase/carnithine racemase